MERILRLARDVYSFADRPLFHWLILALISLTFVSALTQWLVVRSAERALVVMCSLGWALTWRELGKAERKVKDHSNQES